MGIVKNNKNIIAIYRGDKKITSVFKNNLKIFENNDEPVVFDNIINSKLQTTSVNQTKTLTSKQEYFDSIIVDGETELVSGGTGSLSYKFPQSGTHTVKYKVKDGITDISKIFSSSSYTTEIDANSLDTSNVTNMSESFKSCADLMSLNLSNWKTSKVTNMANMFQSCYDLTSLDVSNFDTSNVTDMSQMFTDLQKITSLDLSNFNTSKVTSMKWLFSGCGKLTNLNLKDWDTSNVTNMEWMFRNNSSLTTLDISGLKTQKVTNMNSMFFGDSKLISLDLSNFDTSNVTNMESMFGICTSLESLNLKKFDINTVTSYDGMFTLCNKLKYIKCTQTFKNWCLANQSELSLPETMKENGGGTWDIYSNAKTIFALGSTLLTSKKEYFSSIKNASKDEELDVSGNGELSISAIGYMDIKYTFKEGLTDLISCFANCNKLDSIDLSDVSFASINDISGLFEGCSSITKISFKDEDLSHISNYTNAFANCKLLKTIVCSESTMNWIKEHSTEMGLNDTMINGTIGKYGRKTNWELYSFNPITVTGQTITLYSYNPNEDIKVTNNKENFSKIFLDDILLDISGSGELFYTSKGSGFINGKFELNEISSSIFMGCNQITELDLSGFNGNIQSFDLAFFGCNSLEKLYFSESLNDISQYNTDRMFLDAGNLRTIRCKKAVKDYLVSNSSSVNLPSSLEYGSEGQVGSDSAWELYDYEPPQPGEGGQSLKIWSDYPGDYIKITNSQEKFNSITVDEMPLNVDGYGELRFDAQRDGEIIADFSLKTDQIDYPGLFEGCDKIMEIDLSGFDFSMALNCDYMFRDCNRLQKVYFPDNIERLESMSYDIFSGCNELQTIRCTRRMKDWFFEDPDRFQLPDNLRYGSEGGIDSGSNWELYDY